MSLNHLPHRRVLASAVTALIAGLAIGVAGSTPALATTSGSLVVANQTAAPGGTISATLTPTVYGAGSGDLAYYCDGYNSPTDSSGMSDPGHSTVLLLMGSSGDPIVLPAGVGVVTVGVFIEFDGPGVGSFTPGDNVTTPSTLSFTLPSDIPDGDYTVMGGCVSPQYWSVDTDSSYFTQDLGTITVSSSSPSPESLPNTGASNDGLAFVGGAGVVALIAGIAFVLARRRSVS